MSIVLVLILLLGLSYAWFTLTLTGTKRNVIRVGNLSLDLKEGEAIQMNAALPISDRNALGEKGYQFSLTNDGTIASQFELTFDFKIEEADNTTGALSEYTNFALKKNGKIILLDRLTDLPGTNQVLDLGILETGETNQYELYLFLDSQAILDDMEYTYDGEVYTSYNDQVTGTIKITSHQLKERTLMQTLQSHMATCSNCAVNEEGEQHYLTSLAQSPYIWYSGKMWRAISYNDNGEIKAITATPQTVLPWGNSVNFSESNVSTWINDTSGMGFLGNLYHYEDFLVTNYPWNYSKATHETLWTSIGNDTIIRGPVGILNSLDITKNSQDNIFTADDFLTYNAVGYYIGNPILSNGSEKLIIASRGILGAQLYFEPQNTYSQISPAIVFQNKVKVISGKGTEIDPYILKGDERIKGNLLNTSVSGEYVAIGDHQNSIYRIVGSKDGKIQVVLANGLVENFVNSKGNDVLNYINGNIARNKYSTANDYTKYDATSEDYPIAYFLNHNFLNSANGYFTKEDLSMIEQDQTWDLTTLVEGQNHYQSASKSTSTATVGFLKAGDQLAVVQTEDSRYYLYKNKTYTSSLLLTIGNTTTNQLLSYNPNNISQTNSTGYTYRPSFYLKSSVKIKSGRGTRYDPYILTLE